MTRTRTSRIGSHPAAVWAIKHLVSPLDRFVVKISHGSVPPLSSIAVPTVLLTVVGRRSGLERTVPLVCVRDGRKLMASRERPLERGAIPHFAFVAFAGALFGQSEVVQVPTGEWVTIGGGWGTATEEQRELSGH